MQELKTLRDNIWVEKIPGKPVNRIRVDYPLNDDVIVLYAPGKSNSDQQRKASKSLFT
jgi:hypothetical protein